MMDEYKLYNPIWDKISTNIKIEFDSKPVHNENFLETESESYNDKVAYFQDKEIPKAGYNHIYLAVVTIDSAFKRDKNY